MTRRRGSSTIPFGWELDPDNTSMIREVDDEQETLSYLKTVKDNFSLRTLARVVEAKHSHKVTPRGMQQILNRGY